MLQKSKIFVRENYLLLGLISVVILGAVLRLNGLTYQNHWLDELYSVYFSSPSNSFGEMLYLTLTDIHPPLYQTILWVWYQLFGYTEFTGRLLSAIIGIFGIIAVFYLGKELFNKYVGLYASYFVSINYYAIAYSQEVRSYSLLFFLTVISYIFFLRVFNDYSKRNVIFYWLSTIALLYTHYFGFFLVASQVFIFLFYIVQFSDQRNKLITIAVLTFVVYSLSLLPIIKFILDKAAIDDIWIQTPSISYFVGYIKKYFNSLWLLILFAIGGTVSMVYLLTGNVKGKEKNSLIVLLIWIFIVYLLPYLRSVFSTPLLASRYTITVLPAIILISTYGLWRMNGWQKAAILSLISIVSIYVLGDYYSTQKKGQYREVLAIVDKYDKYQSVPIYSLIWKKETNHFQAYSDLLNLNLTIRNSRDLEKEFQGNKLPKCFWVLDAFRDHIKNSEILNSDAFDRVYTTNLKGAQGVYFSHGVDPMYCSKKLGMQLN